MRRETTKALVAQARRRRGLLRENDAIRITGRADAVRCLIASGHWQEVLPGVLAAATAVISPDLLEGAALCWTRGSVLSHFSAARHEGFWVPANDQAWITTAFTSGARTRDGVRVVRSRSLPELVRKEGFYRWTPPARTVADLASELTRKQLEAVLLSAIRLGKTTAAQVNAAAEPLKRRPGIQMLHQVTSLWTPERESLLEDGLHTDVCSVVPWGVTRQHPIYRENGSLLARFDVAIEELRLGFEADGLFFHSTDEQIAHDQGRDRGAMGRGWLVARFREGPLSDHARVQREIRAIVEQRGLRGRAA